ncbi:MAG TPA: N4-gp56 family major capsid protein [Desulfobacterales bacterium]|nr:N4-gp56 family major capsid protein [Desulfobacterales bacterium]
MSEYTHYGDISPRTNFAAWGKLLKRTVPGIVTERTAQTKPMPKGKGRVMIFRRYLVLARATGPLQEGVTPPGTKPQYVDVQCTLEQYGDWIGLTDVIQDTHEDPVLAEFKGLQSRQMRETREDLNIGILKGGTSVLYANGAARTDVNTFFDKGDLKKVIRSLRGSDAEYYMEILAGSPKYATEPIGASFVGFGHTDIEADLTGIAGCTKVQNYPDPSKAMPYEVCAAENIRFLLTTMFSPWADAGGAKGAMLSTTGVNADVYPVIVVAPDAWCTVPLRGVNSGNIAVVNPKPRGGDPLGQRGTLGWKFWHAGCILSDELMERIECAVTENPT